MIHVRYKHTFKLHIFYLIDNYRSFAINIHTWTPFENYKRQKTVTIRPNIQKGQRESASLKFAEN